MAQIAQLPFGRTTHPSTRLLLGAAAFSDVTQAEADATMDVALSYGINHVDTAASYGDAELRLGDWIRRHGRPFFLATKTGERTAGPAREEIRRSLERLQVDQVDLIQLHHLVDPQEWEVALGPGGALERFDFDSVLLPYSYTMMQNEAYRADFEVLYALCRERNVAIQTIKSIVHTPWGHEPHTRATWYKPLEAQQDIDTAVQWALGRPGIFLNTVGDIHVLPKVLEAAARYTGPISDEEMKAEVERLEMRPLFEEA